MAGGRLTLEDRRSIVVGIAERVPYAEIARRIGRPTSTVSREVARNGHGNYTAERPPQATPRQPRKGTTTLRATYIADHKIAFIDEFATVLAATGMPRMASRVFARLITSETDNVTAAELVRELGVSPASVSKAIGYLENMELVERQLEPGTRRERYCVGEDVWTRAIRADSSGHASVADVAHRGLTLFGAATAAGIRLAQTRNFFSGLTEQLRGNDLANPSVSDAMTVVAALGHTRRSMTSQQLASALGWTGGQLADAVRELRTRPALSDPFTVHEGSAGYQLQMRPERLSNSQRAALDESAVPTDAE